MSERKAITKQLSELLKQYIDPHNDARVYYAREVTFDYGLQSMVRVDFMEFRPRNNTVSGIESGVFYAYEVKSSVDDFHSKYGHNFIADYNYYVMPQDVYEKIKQEIPQYVGVLMPVVEQSQHTRLHVVRAAKRHDRKRPCVEMLLMMFRSAHRDILKIETT